VSARAPPCESPRVRLRVRESRQSAGSAFDDLLSTGLPQTVEDSERLRSTFNFIPQKSLS